MVIYDHDKFKFISQIFLLLALLIYFIVGYYLKRKNVVITYKIALRLMLLVLPIVLFPFIFLTTMSLLDKFILTLIAISGALLQFYGTKAFHKMVKESSPSGKV